MMERRRVVIENIHIGSRHREPDAAKVKEIARSISEVGLMNPPAVVFRDEIEMDGELLDNVPVLIYGRHRLLALQSLGETSVECIVHDVDDLHAELMEIDENLARAELSPAQEAAHILRRQAIWEEINKTGETNCSTSLSDGRGSGPQHKKQFAAELADITGGSKQDINRKLRRARELGEDTQRIENTSLDSGVEMDALIKLPAPERASLIDRASRGEKVSARPVPEPKPTSADKALEIMAADFVAEAESEEEQAAAAIIERYGADEMPFLLNHLKPRIADAIRARL